MALEPVISFDGGDLQLLADVNALTGAVTGFELHNGTDQLALASFAGHDIEALPGRITREVLLEVLLGDVESVSATLSTQAA